MVERSKCQKFKSGREKREEIILCGHTKYKYMLLSENKKSQETTNFRESKSS